MRPPAASSPADSGAGDEPAPRLRAAPIMASQPGSAFGLQNLSAAPADLDAGAHSDINVHIGIQQPAMPSTPGDQIRDLTVHLPPGLVGDPTGPASHELRRPALLAGADRRA